MTTQNQTPNACRCEKTACGRPQAQNERCTCGAQCACQARCECGSGCGCANAR